LKLKLWNVGLDDIIEPGLREKFVSKDVFTFASAYIENLGNGKFSMNKLPVESQLFPIFSFCIEDLNDDGNADILAVGNIDAVQPDFGRYDAGYGLVLLGDGGGKFTSVDAQQSGFVVRGQGRDIKMITNSNKEKIFLISRKMNDQSIQEPKP
jgi:hypothetical protein